MDFGCGNMFTAIELLKIKPNMHITGLDVIRDQNLTDEILADKHIDFKITNTKELPFADNSFDVVLALATMHHTPDPEYYLSELKRVIKPTGAIILVEEMYLNQLDRVYISAQDWILNKMKKGVPVPLNFRSNDQYKDSFKKLSLHIDFEGSIRPVPTMMHHYVYKLTK
jgi:ubiquinone/menaquinone biosynthesis C-methylase UbiE